MPNFSIAFKRDKIVKSQIKMLQLAALIRIYELENQDFPVKLTDMEFKGVEDLLTENMTGKQFVYEVFENSVRIYADLKALNEEDRKGIEKTDLFITLNRISTEIPEQPE